jgi:hypothetical protein
MRNTFSKELEAETIPVLKIQELAAEGRWRTTSFKPTM